MRNSIIKLFFRVTKFLIYRHDYSPVKYRKGMDFFTSFLGKSGRVQFEREMVGHMEALWIKHSKHIKGKIILYLHGGGYGMGSIQSHQKLVSKISLSAGVNALMIEYRLAPEHPFPAALDDAYEAYQWLLKKGYSPDDIIIGGDSAGGGLTLATLLLINQKNEIQPKAAICLSPWVDLTAASPEMDAYQKNDPFIDKESIKIWAHRYAGDDLNNPLVSPLFADLSGIAPLLVQVGTSEILLFENRAFQSKAKAQHVSIKYVEYPEMVHVFQVFSGFLPQADKAIHEIGEFVKETFSS
jgi:monoterpene epsilon-lactone hydrolase